MRLFAWLTAAVGAVLTLCYLLTGPGGDGDWVNGFLAGPFLLLFLLPDLLSLAGSGTPSGKSGSRTPASTARRSGRHGTGGAPACRSATSRSSTSCWTWTPRRATPSARWRAGSWTSRNCPGSRRACGCPCATCPGRPRRARPRGWAAGLGRAGGTGGAGHRRHPEEVRRVTGRVRLARGGREREITARQLRIAEEGRDAQAVVVAMTPTGEVREGRAVVRLTLRVTRPDGSVFDSTQEKHLPAGLAPGLQPGTVVPVRYLPEAESEVVVLLRPHP